MPRHPSLGTLPGGIRGSVFSSLADRIADFPGEVYPFHVGDTWLEPPTGSRLSDLSADQPDLHRYTEPRGLPELRRLLGLDFGRRNRVEVSLDQVVVCAGATGALSSLAHTLVNPGDNVLILAPYWPLIEGIVRSAHGEPRAIATLDLHFLPEAEAVASLTERLVEHLDFRSVAIYVSSPNNPTGRLLPAAWLATIAGLAREHDLWILCDDVYDRLVFRGEWTSTFCRAPERTCAASSFSKAYAMAGNRCGYLVAPPDVAIAASKLVTHSFYSTPTGSQHSAIAALEGGDEWLADACRRYRAIGDEAAAALGLEAPQAGTFLFFDAQPALDEGGLMDFLEACASRGLLLAPGPSFGPYPTWARLCYTAVEPQATRRGLRVLRELLSQRGFFGKTS